MNVDKDPLFKMIFHGINNQKNICGTIVAFDALFKGGQALPYQGTDVPHACEDVYLLYEPHPDFDKTWGICDLMIHNMEFVSADYTPHGPVDEKIRWRVAIPNGIRFFLNSRLNPVKGELIEQTDFFTVNTGRTFELVEV